MLAIHDILIRIRIVIPYLWLADPDSALGLRILLFSTATFKMVTKFFCHYFLKQHLHHKEVLEQVEWRFFLLFLLDDRRTGSIPRTNGSGRSKKTNRISNTACGFSTQKETTVMRKVVSHQKRGRDLFVSGAVDWAADPWCPPAGAGQRPPSTPHRR